MKQLGKRTRSACVAIALCSAVAACGTDESSTPTSLALEQPTTTVETTTSTAVSSTASAENPPPEMELTPEMFEGLLESEGGRSMLVSSITAESDLDTETAECLLDSIPVEALIAAAEGFLGGAQDSDGFFPPEQQEALAPLLEACGADPDALMP